MVKKVAFTVSPQKCVFMSIGRSQLSLLSKYTMTDESGIEFVLQKSNTERDLGIHIDCCLNFSEHIYKITHNQYNGSYSKDIHIT